MNKIAVCFYGLSNGINSKGHRISFMESINNLKRLLKNQNIEFDFFYHTWDNEKETSFKHNKILKKLINPKKYLFEDLILFDEIKDVNNIKSRWYSNDKAVKLCLDYSSKENIQYDFMFVTRFDCYFKRLYNFSSLKKNRIYISRWIFPYSIVGFLDYWYITDFKLAHNFSNVSNLLTDSFLKKNYNSNHNILKSITMPFNSIKISKEHRDFYLCSRQYQKQKLHFRIKVIFKYFFKRFFLKNKNIWE